MIRKGLLHSLYLADVQRVLLQVPTPIDSYKSSSIFLVFKIYVVYNRDSLPVRTFSLEREVREDVYVRFGV